MEYIMKKVMNFIIFVLAIGFVGSVKAGAFDSNDQKSVKNTQVSTTNNQPAGSADILSDSEQSENNTIIPDWKNLALTIGAGAFVLSWFDGEPKVNSFCASTYLLLPLYCAYQASSSKISGKRFLKGLKIALVGGMLSGACITSAPLLDRHIKVASGIYLGATATILTGKGIYKGLKYIANKCVIRKI
jgi:hypothetical protein